VAGCIQARQTETDLRQVPAVCAKEQNCGGVGREAQSNAGQTTASTMDCELPARSCERGDVHKQTSVVDHLVDIGNLAKHNLFGAKGSS